MNNSWRPSKMSSDIVAEAIFRQNRPSKQKTQFTTKFFYVEKKYLILCPLFI